MPRLELVLETLRAALHSLVVAAPDRLRRCTLQDWVQHYARQADEFHCLTKDTERAALAVRVGTDDYSLLTLRYSPNTPEWLQMIDAVTILRRVQVPQFTREANHGDNNRQYQHSDQH